MSRERPISLEQGLPLSRTFYHTVLILILLGGIGVRFWYFAAQRPVWLDEAGLALNIVGKPWSALLGPLDASYSKANEPTSIEKAGFVAKQTVPLGYLAMLKAAAAAGREHVTSLRLPSFLFAFIWLVGLGWYLWRQHNVSNLILLATLSFSSYLIEYSVEIKQYGLEAVVATGLQLLFLRYARTESPPRSLYVALIAAGMISVWFSFSAAFVLLGNGVVLLAVALRRKDLTRGLLLTMTCGFWVLSFGLYYFFLLRDNFALQAHAYANAFPPLNSGILTWTKDALLELWQRPIGLEQKGQVFGMFMAILGALVLWNHRRLETLLILSPIGVTVVMSVLHQYPWSSMQLLLFLSYNLSILFATGVAASAGALRTVNKYAPLIPIGFVTLLLANSTARAVRDVWEHDYFKTTDFLGIANLIRAEPGPKRIFVARSDGIICRYYEALTGRWWQDAMVSETSFFSNPQDVSQFSVELIQFAAGKECWVITSKVFWPPMTEALLLANVKDKLTLERKCESNGYVALKLRPAGDVE